MKFPGEEMWELNQCLTYIIYSGAWPVVYVFRKSVDLLDFKK
jgi:hypothetical protein